MYLQHYGFRDKPFKLTHDPAYYYGEAHQVPLNELCYSIEERHGLAILLGEAGTGKTTLLLRLLRSFSRHLHGVFLDGELRNPPGVYDVVRRDQQSDLRIDGHDQRTVDFEQVVGSRLRVTE